MLTLMLEEASAETSGRIIAVLGPRLEEMTRLVVELHLEPSIRGDRRVRSKPEVAKCLDDVIAAATPDSQVGSDNPWISLFFVPKFTLPKRLRMLLSGSSPRRPSAERTLRQLEESRRQLKMSRKMPRDIAMTRKP
ncbi:unnamed protein product [Phytophthora fragariaefolia]|uniref:Unnamed protein product n=1 Tax=Phytophthora fragariaefolia TaxID=1490495 RepID=A0A9W6UER8_9STRA|nr:unnamed protein product [Phytophthora fragariaefolia]